MLDGKILKLIDEFKKESQKTSNAQMSYDRKNYMANRDHRLNYQKSWYNRNKKEPKIKPQKNWTEQEERDLIMWKDRGYNFVEIAQEMKRSYNSIRLKYKQLC